MNNQLLESTPAPPAETPQGVAAELVAAIARGDVDAVGARLAPGVVLHVPGTHRLAGDHRGPEGVLAFIAATAATAGGSEELVPLDVLGGEQHAAVYFRVRATRPGRPPLDNFTIHLLRVDGGQVSEIWLHNFDDVAVDDFWS